MLLASWRDNLDIWSLVIVLIERCGCTQLLVSLGCIYRLELSMVSLGITKDLLFLDNTITC